MLKCMICGGEALPDAPVVMFEVNTVRFNSKEISVDPWVFKFFVHIEGIEDCYRIFKDRIKNE